ncbi:16S rRNA (adenine(1518)-N(6)/adenine(1519)-N(6))-dimethyltransferase RsmA [Hydrogenibacillus sp. N12]|uniref:16S rRNA (adenine(1518)-N(6)/adenine(1519)-N(6))- dimethyltransferase RsmA n=1 Tax=Hydrogenibacillus sp. N12 TaxID=2866627 RepID=UPI001C7CA650|nr:16S rRNA (adenine(1518)-N(6)/adenine(1519)-N(6))-dimethyltransferase RsmA [Hydrogenibacillus sp. N12]QZA33059.1 16S rRNA (adenine(1518)-N(6)/adenine(1519)-N(6))-dimethyltransferase RsmA [Hydrogenibacillus sp. N12]
MNVDPRRTKALARALDLRPVKSRGQHFLTAPHIVDGIVTCAGVGPEDGVLEIGPGLGALTAALAERVRRVVAVEIDRRLVAALNELFADRPSVHIVEGDVLAVDLPELLNRHFAPETPVHVVANLPYYITSPILFRLLEHGDRFRAITIMVQKEVADRLAATPGTKAYGALTASVARFARVEKCLDVPAGAFFPPPAVASRVVRLVPHRPSPYAGCREGYVHLVAVAFKSRRKTLVNNLRQAHPALPIDWGAWLEAHGYDAKIRGEMLAPDDFCRLGAALWALLQARTG